MLARSAWIFGAVATLVIGACTLGVDLEGYSGGAADTGGGAADTGAAEVTVDTATPDGPPAETTADTSVAETTVGDTAVGDTTADDTTPGDTGATDSGTADTSDAPPTCHVVINEVQSRGPAGAMDEFVELYNPCTTTLSLSGVKLMYRSMSGGTETTLVALSGSLGADTYNLYSSAGGTHAAKAEGTFSPGISDDGSVGLKDAAGALIDSVGFGAVSTTNPYIETAAAPGPGAVSGPSISRIPNGFDTNNNSFDFKKTVAPTPKAKN